MLRAGLLSFPAEQRVGEGVISQRAGAEVQRGRARALGGGIWPLARPRKARGALRGWQGELGGGSPSFPPSPTPCLRLGEMGAFLAARWAGAAPGYPHTLAAGCIWVYPCKSSQPELLLAHPVEEGVWVLADVDMGMRLLTGRSQGWPPPKAAPAPPRIALPSAAEPVPQMLRARLRPLG